MDSDPATTLTADTRTKATSKPLRFVEFEEEAAKTPVNAISRTLRYAQDPRKYLRETLGSEKLEATGAKLCLAETVDKDFYGAGEHKQHFERFIARLVGKEHGLFFITGVQAQLAALKTYCDHAGHNRVAWHRSSHLESAEEQAWSLLYHLDRILLGENPEENPTVEEIREVLLRPRDQRPAAILLEIPNRTLGCKTYTFEELQVISQECRRANVKLHCDGARLFEIEPYYLATAGQSFHDLGALFDSVYVSFYKGLAGSAGAILATNDERLHAEAKKWQRRAGGNVFTLFYQVIDAERGYNENAAVFARRWKKMAEIADHVTAATAQFRTKDGKPYVEFLPETPTCCQVHTVFRGFGEKELLVARDQVEAKAGIRVFEKVRTKRISDHKLEDRQVRNPGPVPESGGLELYIEWLLVSSTEQIATETFVKGYVALCEELVAMSAASWA